MYRTLSRQGIHLFPALPVSPIPAKAAACLISCASFDKSLLSIVAASDPGLALALVRVAKRMDRPLSISRLVDRLGEADLRAALHSAVSGIERGNPWPVVLDAIWRDSLATALCAEQLAAVSGRSDSGEAYLGGLLAHAGRYAMAMLDPDGYASIPSLMRDECLSETEAETRVFGLSHGALGKRIADAHGFPRWLADVIWLHDMPVQALPAQTFPSDLIAVVGAATGLTGSVLETGEAKSADRRNAFLDYLALDEAGASAVRASVIRKFRERVGLLEELGAKSPVRSRAHSASRQASTEHEEETAVVLQERLRVAESLNLLHRRLTSASSQEDIAQTCMEALRDGAGLPAGAIVVESDSAAEPVVRIWPELPSRLGTEHGQTADQANEDHALRSASASDALQYLSQRAQSNPSAGLVQIPITEPEGHRLGSITLLVPSEFAGVYAAACRDVARACSHALVQQAREREADDRFVALMQALTDYCGAQRSEGKLSKPLDAPTPAAGLPALCAAAHSMEKPLGAILAELRRLQAQIQDPATYQSLAGMTRQCRKLGSILEDMRFLAGAEPPDYTVSLLNVPIRLHMRSARQSLERSGITVMEKYADGIPRVHMDTRRIVHALANVLGFVEQKLDGIGGDVSIRTDTAADRSSASIRVKVEGQASANPLDAGPINWISKDIRSDMGLAYEVCHSILAEHGGRFSVETTDTTVEFAMTLPAATGAATVRVDDHAPSATQVGGDETVTVLIADDDDSVRDILRQALRMRGYRTEAAKDGIEALNCLIEKHIDVVLLDLLMPNRDGFAVLRELQRRDGPPPVIFMTGNGAPDVRDEALALGAHAFLQKPFELRQLLAEIESVLIKK